MLVILDLDVAFKYLALNHSLFSVSSNMLLCVLDTRGCHPILDKNTYGKTDSFQRMV